MAMHVTGSEEEPRLRALLALTPLKRPRLHAQLLGAGTPHLSAQAAAEPTVKWRPWGPSDVRAPSRERVRRAWSQ